MNRTSLIVMACMCLFLLSGNSYEAHAQDNINSQTRELDLKLQLLDTKLELLDSKIHLWETKPEELDMRMSEIDQRIQDLDFDPDELNRKLLEMDSAIREMKTFSYPHDEPVQEFPEYVEEYRPDIKSAIMLNPVRLFEGTFHVSYERILNTRFSVSVSALATYATQEGLTNYFFENQSFNYYDMSSSSYRDYSGESIAGGGIILEAKNYLLADFPGHRTAPLGLYAAPQILYRRIWITGEDQEWIEDEWVTREVKQQLNVASAGVLLGYKLPFMQVLVIDMFVGGHIRMSKYDGEAGLTKYRNWYNIDFSGVYPTAGIAIGILK